jgi:hypothetical protein
MQHTPLNLQKFILQSVTSDNPDFRYVVGKYADTILEARRSMSAHEENQLMLLGFLSPSLFLLLYLRV